MYKKNVMVGISIGEALDKLSILDIKKKHLKHMGDNARLSMIEHERDILLDSLTTAHISGFYKCKNMKQLIKINSLLWIVEDEIRQLLTKLYMSGSEEDKKRFLWLAIKVPWLNDKRAHYKQKLNKQFGSFLTEIKLYNQSLKILDN